MQDRENFGKYLSQKRKEANLTQEELANRLHVIPTTISKWERAITYPDITIIPKLCQELKISEHEFFMACDDEAMRSSQKEIRNYRMMKKVMYHVFLLGYLIALITTFICNLVIDKTLSWFFIVLVSLAMAFTVTNLPTLLEKNCYRKIKLAAILTLLIYLLLFVIYCVYHEISLWPSFGIATFELVLLWIPLLLITFVKMNGKRKGAIVLLFLAICTACTNPICERMLQVSSDSDNWINVLCAFVFVGVAFYLLGSEIFTKKNHS